MNATAAQLPQVWPMLDAWDEYRRVVPQKFPNLEAAFKAADAAAPAVLSPSKSPASIKKVKGYDEFWKAVSGADGEYVAWQAYIALLKDTLYEVGRQGRDVRDGLDNEISVALSVIIMCSLGSAATAALCVWMFIRDDPRLVVLCGATTIVLLIIILFADMTRLSKTFMRRMWDRALPALGVDNDDSQTTQVCTSVVNTLDVLDSKMTIDVSNTQAGIVSKEYDNFLRNELPTLSLKLNVLSPETIRSTLSLADDIHRNSQPDTSMFEQLQTAIFLLRRCIDSETFWTQRKFLVEQRNDRASVQSVASTLRDTLLWAITSDLNFTATINGSIRTLDINTKSPNAQTRTAIAQEMAARLDRQREASAMKACIELMSTPDDILEDALTNTSVDDVVQTGLQAFAKDVVEADDGIVQRKARGFMAELVRAVRECFAPSSSRKVTQTQFACVWSGLRMNSLLQMRILLWDVNTNLGRNNLALAPAKTNRYPVASLVVQIVIIVVVAIAVAAMTTNFEDLTLPDIDFAEMLPYLTNLSGGLAGATFLAFLIVARVMFSKYRKEYSREEQIRNTKDTVRNAAVLEATMAAVVADLCKSDTVCNVSSTALLGASIVPHTQVLQRDIEQFLEAADNCNLIKSRLRVAPQHPYMDYMVHATIVVACCITVYVLVTNEDAGLVQTLRNARNGTAPPADTESTAVMATTYVGAIAVFVAMIVYVTTSKDEYHAMLKTIYSGSRSCAV